MVAISKNGLMGRARNALLFLCYRYGSPDFFFFSFALHIMILTEPGLR